MRASISITSADDPAEGAPLKGDWEDWFPVLGAIGYRGVELCMENPQPPIEELRRSCESSRLEISAIATGRAFLELGLSLSDADDDRRGIAVERFKSFIELGAALNAPVSAGRICGERPNGGDAGAARGRLEESLSVCAPFARDLGVELLLVPAPRDEKGLLNTAAHCMETIDVLGCGSLRILLDAYCMHREESDLAQSVKTAGDRLGGFRLCDSNGGLPGMGKTDFAPIFRALKSIGFDGFVTVRMEPDPSPKTVAEKAYKFLSRIVE